MILQQLFSEIYTDNWLKNQSLSMSSKQSTFDLFKLPFKSSFCLLSEEARQQRKINQKIESELRKEKRLAKRSLKLLLLGIGESGKSTFLRQMRIIHDRGFETDKERCEYINQIHQNILVIVITIDHAMELLKIPYENVRLSEKLKMILSTSCNYDYIQCWRNRFNAEFDGNTLQNLQSYQQIVQMFIDRLPCKYVNVFKEFWNDSGVKYCLERRNEFNLIDSCGYYMNRIEELLKDNYVPLVQDILQVRIPTNGISEYNFPIESINLKIVDVGGQKTERRKWIHCFESVTSIIYIAALSEFNQFLSEPVSFGETGSMPPLINKLEESKALFKTIVTSRWFRDSSVILFLNKFDIFEEKILSMQKNNDKRLEDYFPDYFQSKMMNSNEKRNDIVDLVAESILSMFYQQNPVYFRKRILYSHFTCATNTDNIKIVFQAVKDTIMQQILCKEMQIF